MPKYPAIEVELVDKDWNADDLRGKVQRALRDHGVDAFEVYEFMDASRGDDYEHLMRVCLEWVTIARWHGPRK